MAQITGPNPKQESNQNNNNNQPAPAFSPENGKFSLLRPPGLGQNDGNTAVAPDEADLGLVSIVRALDIDGRHYRTASNILGELNSNPAIIAYRQDVLYELLRLPALFEQFNRVLPDLIELTSVGRSKSWGDNFPLPQIGARLAELEIYLNCVEALWSALEGYTESSGAQSAGLLALRSGLAHTRQEEVYRNLTVELPRLRDRLNEASSVTLGINLDAQLRPESATLLSVNTERFSGKSGLMQRLLGERAAAEVLRGSTSLFPANDNRPRTPEHELFRELEKMLEKVVSPVAAALSRYTRVSSGWLAALEPEIAFYLGAARLTGELRQAGLAFSRPEIAPIEENVGRLEGCYSLDLALRLKASNRQREVVTNEVNFSSAGHIFIITGPNSGGKTTYTRAIGQAQLLFQAGLPVPATSARLSPVDAIYTHFAREERAEANGGRLAQELNSLGQIFSKASRYSLVMLNEPLTGTDHISARSLGKDLLGGLKLLGARSIFVTHLHELLDDPMMDPNHGIVSLVAVATMQNIDGTNFKPSYKVIPGLPRALANAAELARQHGLSLAQITETLRQRGLIDDK